MQQQAALQQPPQQRPTPVPQQTAAIQPQQAAVPGTQPVATGSINRQASAVVSGVTGAPGDGSVALTSALQRELQKSGLPMADQATAASAYRVEGNVVVGQVQNGKQPIQIDWTLKDPTERSSAPYHRRTRCRRALSTEPGAGRPMLLPQLRLRVS